MLGVIVGLLGCGMLLYLLPGQGTSSTSSADVVAQVDDQAITMTDVNAQLSRLTQNGAIPRCAQTFVRATSAERAGL